MSIQEVRKQMKGAFLERDEEVDAMLTALIARQHVALLGKPGTAKSMLVRTLAKTLGLDGDDYFEILMTEFTTDQEVFGPLSIPKLQQERYERVRDGYLTTARVAFLDEGFKANSAVLNALLTMMNERRFRQGTVNVDVPLEILFTASNELPAAGSSLGALFDRFVVRRWVEPLANRASKQRLLDMTAEGDDPASQVTATISAEHLSGLQSSLSKVGMPMESKTLLLEILQRVADDAQVYISDRRMTQCVKVLKARALLNGRTIVQPADFDALVDVLWDEPEQIPTIRGVVLSAADPDLMAAQETLDAVVELYEGFDFDNARMSQIHELTTKLKAAKESLAALKQTPGVQSVSDQVQGMLAEIGRKIRSGLKAAENS